MNENEPEKPDSGRISHRQKAGGVGVVFTMRPIRRIKDARRGLADVIAAAADDRLDVVKAKLLGYLLSVWVSIVRDSELEDRLSELERKISKDTTGGRL